jgi:hypothetical protein
MPSNRVIVNKRKLNRLDSANKGDSMTDIGSRASSVFTRRTQKSYFSQSRQ